MKHKIRVNTINQYKCLQRIEKIFIMEEIKVEIKDENTIKVTYGNKKELILCWDSNYEQFL